MSGDDPRKVGIDDHLRAGGRYEDLLRVEVGGWPTLAPEALIGLAGRVVETIRPHTEADDVAILGHFLAGVGNEIGPGPHARVEFDQHPCRLFVGIVGRSAKARKGTAWSTPSYLLYAVDPTWARTRIKGGLSTGEGLIDNVRDARQREDKTGAIVTDDAGESDKRLLVIETELASVFRRMNQESNSLSAVLRQAWDSGTLSTLTRNNPLRATGAHISVIGHSTTEEIQRHLTATEMANGFANRFLWLLVRRSKELPEGAGLEPLVLAPLVKELREVVAAAARLALIQRDGEARELWREVYPALSAGEEGLVGGIIARAEAQTLRLSVLYAVLDRSPVVRVPHLRAALALWNYAEASARRLFGGRLGIPLADIILGEIQRRGLLTRSEVSSLLGRHRPAAEIDHALTQLLARGLVRRRTETTLGRPVEFWEPGTPAKKAKEAKEGGGA
jgi:Protein of unknown function (DUF3987)